MTGNKNREFMSVSQFLLYMKTHLNCEDELFCVLRTFLSETSAGCLDKENPHLEFMQKDHFFGQPAGC